MFTDDLCLAVLLLISPFLDSSAELLGHFPSCFKGLLTSI